MRVTTKLKAAAAMAVVAMLNVQFGFWLAGFDFDERGGTALACYWFSLVCGGFAVRAAIQELQNSRSDSAG